MADAAAAGPSTEPRVPTGPPRGAVSGADSSRGVRSVATLQPPHLKWQPPFRGQDVVLLDANSAELLRSMLTFDYNDPTKRVCQCGCQIHEEVNSLIASLCHSLFVGSQWDYAAYKRSVDLCVAEMLQKGTVPDIPRVGFLTLARQVGVTNFAWAIVDVPAAQQALQLVQHTARLRGLPPLRRIISVGAGNGYVESVFLRAARSLDLFLEVVAYDVYPNRQSFVPVYAGTQANILTDFAATEDCLLLLCWPPLGSSLADGSFNPAPDPNRPTNTMASDSIRNFASKGGRFVVYIGERTLFGCTADPAFHHIVQTEGWALLNEDSLGNSTIFIQKWCPQPFAILRDYSPAHFQIGGVSGNDNLWVYFLPSNAHYAWNSYSSPVVLPPSIAPGGMGSGPPLPRGQWLSPPPPLPPPPAPLPRPEDGRV
eukprot:RCo005203